MSRMNRDEWDEQLKQLALQAQQHPPLTRERQKAIAALVKAIFGSNKLYRPPQSRLPPSFYRAYEEIYNDAKQELMLHICQKIEQYNPDRAEVLTWVNMLMDKRFFSGAIAKFKDINEPRISPKLSIDDLDNLENSNFDIEAIEVPVEIPTLSEQVRECIEQDPDGILNNHRMAGSLHVTFQLLLLKRLDRQSWEKISQETGVKVSALSSFYQRSLQQFATKIRRYIQD